MGTCNLDHSHEDVVQKLESQQGFLPERLFHDLKQFLIKRQDQQTLNELFHLLKKYDLSSQEDQGQRNEAILQILSGD